MLNFIKKLVNRKPKQKIYSISFYDLHGAQHTFTLGDSFEITSGSAAMEGKIERIVKQGNVITTKTDVFTVKHTAKKGTSLVLLPLDKLKEVAIELERITLKAKQYSIISPVLANQILESLKDSNNVKN